MRIFLTPAFLFSVAFCSAQKLNTTEVQQLIRQFLADNREAYFIFKSESFVPVLNDSLKRDENFKFMMKEMKERNFEKFYRASRKIPIIEWRNYTAGRNSSEHFYTLRLSTPVIVGEEALLQAVTHKYDRYFVYRKRRGRWMLRYGFGYGIPAVTIHTD